MDLEELNLVELNVQEVKDVEGGFIVEMNLAIFALGFYVGYHDAASVK
ncbi:class IIb bacteriocin, lactobin A/cerein 7B family [Flavobacterium chilense]|uniref:Class IIb bacteriocin, lactobin A/cerein 7B family n=1 Tax=Flavobacterium chilense TaxID=946677 RepID=A0A1M7CD95_9FLAO|nr:class IIb bacteriocin, lactobin A/cerein 7B family [Flavobacterium chilense]SHL65244.1 hypothetical protein SAMN05444484_102112 [Flavobacterium chilense]